MVRISRYSEKLVFVGREMEYRAYRNPLKKLRFEVESRGRWWVNARVRAETRLGFRWRVGSAVTLQEIHISKLRAVVDVWWVLEKCTAVNADLERQVVAVDDDNSAG